MKTILTLVAALSLSGCATSYTNRPMVDGPIRQDARAMLGQPTHVGTVVVTPQQLVEDSRCPMNARCVWAGRVIVRSRIDGAGWRETVDLTLGEPRTVRATSVTLVSVEPQAMAGQPAPAPNAYLFGFAGGL